MPKYLVFWKDSDPEVLKGETLPKALVAHGYGLSSVTNILSYVVDGRLEDYKLIQDVGWIKR